MAQDPNRPDQIVETMAGRVVSLEPEASLPSPWPRWFRSLCAAQMDDVWRILVRGTGCRDSERRDAKLWVRSDDEDFFSFCVCCDVLGIDPEKARRKLLIDAGEADGRRMHTAEVEITWESLKI